jgi:hypothetical protein
MMADGGRLPIETVEIGDKVASFDGKGGLVSQVYLQKSDHIRELRFRRLEQQGSPNGSLFSGLGRLKTTDAHLFWLHDQRSWVAARNLEPGDVLIMADGGKAEVVDTSRVDRQVNVYTFDVEDYYSFFANGVLIRQRCGGDREMGIENRIRRFLEDMDRSRIGTNNAHERMSGVTPAPEDGK